MTTVKPQSELMKQAVSWVSEQLGEKPGQLVRLIDEAGMRFNLSPKDQSFLKTFFSENEPQ